VSVTASRLSSCNCALDLSVAPPVCFKCDHHTAHVATMAQLAVSAREGVRSLSRANQNGVPGWRVPRDPILSAWNCDHGRKPRGYGAIGSGLAFGAHVDSEALPVGLPKEG